MKVTKGFFCIQEKKTYKEGDNYTGKRKDLKDNVAYPKKSHQQKVSASTRKKTTKKK
ncbi:MAG: hypothetical protein GY941_19455 [Planctomycetes bacterium]|nr:hypothetical protein [Planctomycetota bacterium]